MNIEDIKRNNKLLIGSVPYNVTDIEFVKPGKGRAIYRLRLQNLLDNTSLDRTYHSGEKVNEASISTKEKQFLYKEGKTYHFMDTQTFEQDFMTEDQIGDARLYLKEGTAINILLWGDKPIGITPPTFVELQVVKSEVSSKTDTIAGGGKAATLETGLVIDVPTFIKEGDIIKVDTRTGTYVERVAKK